MNIVALQGKSCYEGTISENAKRSRKASIPYSRTVGRYGLADKTPLPTKEERGFFDRG